MSLILFRKQKNASILKSHGIRGKWKRRKSLTFVRTRYSVWLLVKSPTLCGSPTVISNEAFATAGAALLAVIRLCEARKARVDELLLCADGLFSLSSPNAAAWSAGDKMAEGSLSDGVIAPVGVALAVEVVVVVEVAPLAPTAAPLLDGGGAGVAAIPDTLGGPSSSSSSASSELESGSLAFSTASSCVGLALTLRWPLV